MVWLGVPALQHVYLYICMSHHEYVNVCVWYAYNCSCNSRHSCIYLFWFTWGKRAFFFKLHFRTATTARQKFELAILVLLRMYQYTDTRCMEYVWDSPSHDITTTIIINDSFKNLICPAPCSFSDHWPSPVKTTPSFVFCKALTFVGYVSGGNPAQIGSYEIQVGAEILWTRIPIGMMRRERPLGVCFVFLKWPSR